MLFAESPSVFEPQSESLTNSGKAIGLYVKTSPTGGPSDNQTVPCNLAREFFPQTFHAAYPRFA